MFVEKSGGEEPKEEWKRRQLKRYLVDISVVIKIIDAKLFPKFLVAEKI